MSEEESKALPVIPMSVKSLLEARAGIISAWHVQAKADDAVGEAFGKITDKDFYFRFDSEKIRCDEKDPHYIKPKTETLDYSLWLFAIQKMNITSAMTGKAAEEFLERMRERKTQFCEAELIGLFQNAERIFKDSSMNTVREVFRQLVGATYRSGNWRVEAKRDNLQKVERVFRLGHCDLKRCSYRDGVEEDSYGTQHHGFHFNDLLTACRLIEGKGTTDYSNSFDYFVRATPNGCYTVDCGYFTATAYKIGNVKVSWNPEKQDVLDRLNAIGSGRENAMPDVMRKRYKAEHFHDGGMPKAETYFKPKETDTPSAEKDFAFYPTPASVAQRMVTLAEYPTDQELLTLEPSAGDGALLRELSKRYLALATGIEFNHHRAHALAAEFHVPVLILNTDFLQWRTDPIFDRVLMNPPFNDRLEAVHLVKAFSHLKPGGILVGILPEGWFFRDDSKSVILREFLKRNEYKPSEILEAGTFKGTRIPTRIVVLQKPGVE